MPQKKGACGMSTGKIWKGHSITIQHPPQKSTHTHTVTKNTLPYYTAHPSPPTPIITSTSATPPRIYARTHARTHASHTQVGAHCPHNQDHNEAKDIAHRTLGASVFVPPKRAKGFSHHNTKRRPRQSRTSTRTSTAQPI